MSNINLVKCDDNQLWDKFVNESPQNNIFCKTSFLKSLDVNYDLWWITENAESALGVIVLKDADGKPIKAPFQFSLYHGILFNKKNSQMQVHQYVNKSFLLVDYLIAEFHKIYRHISFCLHPTIKDIRSFSWFNYHKPEDGIFNIRVQYTGIIDLTNIPDFNSYLQNIRKSRRYEYRKAIKDNLNVESSTDIDLLEYLYKKTFVRQNINIEKCVLERMKNITESAISGNYGELSVCRNEQGDALSASLFLHDDSCGYYLIGANDPDYRQTGSGIFLVLENIRRYQNLGYNYIDVCGLNSPNRGDFKSSINAQPTPYYIPTWESKL